MAERGRVVKEVLKTDVLVVGSEGAGARAALEVADQGLKPTIVTKGQIARCGATLTAPGDYALDSKSAKDLLGLPGDDRDSAELWFRDMVTEGKYLNNQKMVEVFVEDAPQRIMDLVDYGMKWVSLHGPFGGQTYARSVSGGLGTGVKMMNVLRKTVKKRGIQVVPDIMITDLVIKDGQAVGAVGLDLRRGEFNLFLAKAIVMATGGAMRIYPHTTAPEELTGEGHAAVFRAGGELVDMEQVQFMPVTFVSPPALQGVDFPAIFIFNIEAYLLNRKGERFMKKWDPERMEHSTRDNVAIGVMTEILEGRTGPAGGVYVSFKHLPERIIDHFAESYGCGPKFRYAGFNMTDFIDVKKEGAVEAAPASHFFQGGVRVDENGATNIPGLFVGGELCGGLHGGCRISGHAITQTQVQGQRSGKAAALFAGKQTLAEVKPGSLEEQTQRVFSPLERASGVRPFEIKKRIQRLAWEKVAIIRDGALLEKAIGEIESIKRDCSQVYSQAKGRVFNREWLDSIQVESMIATLEMITRSAIARKESRGVHYRKDLPKMEDKHWIKNMVIQNDHGAVKVVSKPVEVTRMQPPKE